MYEIWHVHQVAVAEAAEATEAEEVVVAAEVVGGTEAVIEQAQNRFVVQENSDITAMARLIIFTAM